MPKHANSKQQKSKGPGMMPLFGIIMILGLVMTGAGVMLPLAGFPLGTIQYQPSYAINPSGTSANPTQIPSTFATNYAITYIVSDSASAQGPGPQVYYALNSQDNALANQHRMAETRINATHVQFSAVVDLSSSTSGYVAFYFYGAVYSPQSLVNPLVVTGYYQVVTTNQPKAQPITFQATYGTSGCAAKLAGDPAVAGLSTPVTVNMMPGTYTITATYQGQSNTQTFTVTDAFSIQPIMFTIPVSPGGGGCTGSSCGGGGGGHSCPGGETWNATSGTCQGIPATPTTGILDVMAKVNNVTATGSQVQIQVGNDTHLYSAPCNITLDPGTYEVTAYCGSATQNGSATIVAGTALNVEFDFSTPPAAPNLFNALTLVGLTFTVIGLFGMVAAASIGRRRQ